MSYNTQPDNDLLDKFDRVLIEWVSPFMFSIVVMVLISTILLITKIRYSKTSNITQLSLYPHYVIIAYLIFEGLEILLILTKVEQLDDEIEGLYFANVIWSIIGTCSTAKFVAYTMFVNTQVFEWFIILFFISY